ncbi:MAG: Glycosyl transferase, group 2 family protein [Parcubacteria group bacterium GW2011_GWA2_47_26]|nr:MAG: Glycosyl transferase, group 2 family protein [Parcubacteria group bacterium GW2011_GWA2_47_26]
MNELSIVVPCVSTIETLPKFIDELARYLMVNPSDVDLIVVANPSAKNPEMIVEYARKNYPWLKMTMLQRSSRDALFGALTRFGIAHSASRYAAIVSPYGEDDLSIIPKMLLKIRQGAQVVQATRYTKPEDARGMPFKFKVYQVIYRTLTRALLRQDITDSTYGFKMFDRAFIQALGLTQNGYSICPEITLKALLAKGKVGYVSSVMKPSPLNKDFNLVREGLGYLWILARGFGHRLGILWF